MTCPTDYGPNIHDLCQMAGSAVILMIVAVVAFLICVLIVWRLYKRTSSEGYPKRRRGR